MVSIRRAPQAEEANFGTIYKLFVEGDNESSIDPIILRRLLNDTITVRPLGPSTHIRSAAKSLHRHHPTLLLPFRPHKIPCPDAHLPLGCE